MQSARGKIDRPDEVKSLVISLDQFASRTSYSHWATASDFTEEDSLTAATFTKVTDTTPAHWGLSGTAEVAQYVYYYMRRPENWHRGHCEFVIHYGGSSATGNYRILVGHSFSQHNTALTTFTDNAAILTVPTSGTGRLLLARPKDTLDTTFASAAWATSEINPKAVGAFASTVPPIHDGLHFRVGRDATHASDTSTGTFRLYGLEILFFPHEGAVGHIQANDYYRNDSRL